MAQTQAPCPRLAPDAARRPNDQFQLAALVVPVDRVARRDGSKAAPWAQRQPIERHLPGRFLNPPPQQARGLELGASGIDQPQDDGLIRWDEAQRLECASFRVAPQQKAIDVQCPKQRFGYPVRASLSQQAAAGFTTYVQPERETGAPHACQAAVVGFDSQLQPAVRSDTFGLHLP